MNDRKNSQPQSDNGDVKAGRQSQESRQSGQQPGAGRKQDDASKAPPGIGSSQGQDKGTREKDQVGHSGTADIERGSAHDTGQAQDSMVNDPTGAFKERP